MSRDNPQVLIMMDNGEDEIKVIQTGEPGENSDVAPVSEPERPVFGKIPNWEDMIARYNFPGSQTIFNWQMHVVDRAVNPILIISDDELEKKKSKLFLASR